MRRNPLAIALAVAGLLCLLLGAWSLAQLRVQLARGPMLLSPSGLAVDPGGTLLIGIDAARVHAYDAEGTFLRAWNVSPGGGPFRLRSLGPGRVEVAGERSPTRWEYDLEGRPLSETRDPGAFERFGAANDAQASGAGTRFAIRDGALFRLEPAPEQLLVPALHRPLSLFVDQLPVLAVLVMGGAAGLIGGVAFSVRRPGDGSV